MKLRILFWVLAAPFLSISGLLALLFLISICGASDTAAKNQQQRIALLKRAELVDSFLRKNGQLPTVEEFAKASSKAGDGMTYMCELHTSRPLSGDFRFPEWPEGKSNFAIGYWRGEWYEFYDSNSRSSTLDRKSETYFWVKDALVPLAGAAIFSLPPLLLLWIWKRMQKQKPSPDTP